MAEDGGGRERSDASCGDDSDSDSTLNGNPLAQLQSALQKTGALGSALEGDANESPLLAELVPARKDLQQQPQQPPSSTDATSADSLSPSPYRCHMCTFQGRSKAEYNGHMATHLDHKCPMCDYRSRTEGRLKRHVKDFHSDDQWQQTLPGADECKDRTFRCRQCGHVAASKTDFWEHSKVHIRSEKLLTCPKCPFVTEYKHHLEYHLRNHFGSKPFKCSKCNYSCVNKSMLNSHLKSHSNVYQYRCADCNYATKYCHSLKLHLRKYVHRPASVLHSDGSPNPFPVLDVYGTRRGPRRGPRGYPPQEPAVPALQELGVQGQPLVGLIPAVACAQQQMLHAAAHASSGTVPWKCSVCDFATPDDQQMGRHVMGHAESQDLFRLHGFRNLANGLPQPPPLQQLQAPPPQQMQQPQQIKALQGLQSSQPVPHEVQDAVLKVEQTPPTPAVDVPYVSSTSSHEPPPPRDERRGSPLDLSRAPADLPRSRRKGRAMRIDKLCMRLQDASDAEEEAKNPESAEPSSAAPQGSPSILASRLREVSEQAENEQKPKDSFRCVYCDIAFEHCVMYTVHMGYHGYHDPFTCNMCGQRSEDKLAFFLHIARAAHL
ncbi:hypothetical protein V5799_032373 [Amblyomma americanum]|uniref:Protein hunchback n=1 Tax=Amblyomma americanum TaxID=6943 RepID=A0AAQ4DRC4_AMBAM